MEDFLVDLDDRGFLLLGGFVSRHGMALLSEVCFVSFHSKCKVWGQCTDTVQQFKEPGQRSVPQIF